MTMTVILFFSFSHFVFATTSVGRQCTEYSNQSFSHEMATVEPGTVSKHPGNADVPFLANIQVWVSETQTLSV